MLKTRIDLTPTHGLTNLALTLHLLLLSILSLLGCSVGARGHEQLVLAVFALHAVCVQDGDGVRLFDWQRGKL